ncbi:multidrug transporter AcrB [Chitinophaga cymbidii]|uniref:Multidrug transporter AcrB n=2 Tax=Chitinophaga cymbidii TaxID=1096750 RepID=A0A512RPY5_9BACT|nr:multidrug transporter AcrB [Chitinophaga cymbidii]
MVMFGALLILIGGGYVASRMEVDVFPDLTAPTVVVLTESHGMAPEEVEKLVTFPIESALNGATDVRRVRSSSSAGISIVWVEFEWGTDIFKARQITTEKLVTVAERLPEGVGNPVLAPQASIMGEIMLIAVTGDSTDMMNVRTLADWTIRPRLLATAGVANVVVIGGEYKQYQVLADPRLMKHYGVSLDELLAACRNVSQNSSGGFINEYGNEYIVRGMARTNDVQELGNAVVKTMGGAPVKIADVAAVQIGSAPKIGDGSMRGKDAVILTVSKQPNTNTLELTGRIQASLAAMQQDLPKGVNVHSDIFSQSDFINASIHNVKRSLIEGMLFVVVVLFVFLMNWRSTLISLLAIPVSLLVAVLALKWMGFTINTMSLGGMAIAIGALVDDAIIDVDNVLKRLRENALKPAAERRNALEVIYDASVEIRASILNATLIIIAAFVPLFFLTGMEGRMLAPLGISFIVSLFASLIVAVTLTPVLGSYLLTNEKQLLKQAKGSWLEQKVNGWYGSALEKAMHLKRAILIGSVGLFIVAVFLFFRMGRSFLPEFNEGSLVISAVSLPGISLEESNSIGRQIEKALLTIPEIRTSTRRTGRAELDEHAQGVNASEIDVPFTLKDRDRDEFLEDVRGKLAGITGANITIGQPIGHRIDHMLSGTRANIAIKLFGDDLNKMYTLSNQIKMNIQNIPGLVDLSVEPQIEIPQVQIKANREMLARYGIKVSDFTEFVDVAMAGEKASEVFEGEKRFDLILKYNDANRNTIENMRNTLIADGSGQMIPLSNVAEVISTKGPNTVNRENVQRKVVISANVAGRDIRSVVTDIQKAVGANVQLPEGYHLEYGGQFESEAAASRTLLFTSLVALLIILLLLYQEFKNLKMSGIILLNLPLALIGGVVSIWLTSGVLSIPAIIGFITLFGVATRNGILLVSHYHTLQLEGYSLHDTIIKGSVDRLTPILMTALTAALALIPLAVAGDEPGNEIQSPMAKVILGGLLSSTLLNIFVVPIVYYIVQQKEQKHA